MRSFSLATILAVDTCEVSSAGWCLCSITLIPVAHPTPFQHLPTDARCLFLYSPPRCLFSFVCDRVGRHPAPSHADNQKRTDEGKKGFLEPAWEAAGGQGTYPVVRERVSRLYKVSCWTTPQSSLSALHPIYRSTRPSPPPALFGILFSLFLVFSPPPMGLPLLSSPSGDDKTRQSV